MVVNKNPFPPHKYPNCFRGHEYALDVVNGKIVACKYVIGACKRYLKDLERAETHPDWYFNPDKAERFLRLAQRFEHAIGDWKTKNIVFEPWQCWAWMNIMGFIRRKTGYRRFRLAHLEVARGNGKSALGSVAALYFAFLEPGQGNQVATVATKKDQARIVLDSARVMADKNPSFLKSLDVKVLAHSIFRKKTNAIVRALSADSKSQDGLNDILAVMDELHAMKREMFEVISSGMSKRADSLILCITTAGFNMDSVGFYQSQYAKKICLGEIEDSSTDQTFAVVYCPDPGDDIFQESTWQKANPNWGVSVDPDSFRAKFQKAMENPEDIPGLKVKHLNIWLSEAESFFDREKFEVLGEPGLLLSDFEKKECYIGIDLASHIDLATYVLCFYQDGHYIFFDRTFLPEDTFNRAHNAMFDNARARGQLIVPPGEAINYEFIRNDIEATVAKHRVLEAYYDPWNATDLAQNLAHKVEMVKFGMNVGNLSEPMKQLDAAIRRGKVRHSGSPLMNWCIGNVVAKVDHNGNVFPRKNHERLKIDIAVAMIMAMAGWVTNKPERSVYETRGVRTLRVGRR